MRGKVDPIAVLISVACAFAFACTEGGQSSDDGAPLDAGGQPDSGPDHPDASAPELATIVSAVPDGESTVGCAAGFTAAQAAENKITAILEAPQHCEGNSGAFICDCDGERHDSSAFGCVAALFQACGVEAEPLDGSGERAAFATECEGPYNPLGGECAQRADGDYACSCLDESGEESSSATIPARATQSPASCEQALFTACAQSCSDDFGACEPSEDGTIGEYACECATNGLTRAASGPSCAQALAKACSPFDDWSEESCTGYGGHCDALDRETLTEMRCTCADGETHDVEQVSPSVVERLRVCRETLEATCGLGSPPDGAQCVGEGNGYEARCTRGPDPDARLVCECNLEGSLDENARVSTADTHSCDAAMVTDYCPQIEALDASDRQRACEHYERCNDRIVGFALDACLEHASDACVACTVTRLEQLAEGADGCPVESVLCDGVCESIVPREAAVAACEMHVLERGPLTEEATCLCDSCYPAFGNCAADSICMDIIECAGEQGCTASTCEQDPVCGPLIMQHYSTYSLSLALNVGACEARDECRELRTQEP